MEKRQATSCIIVFSVVQSVSVCLLTFAALWSLSVLQDGYTGNKTLQTATKEQAKLKDLPKSLQVFVLLMKEIELEPRGCHCSITSWQAGTDSGPFNKRNIHICSGRLQQWHTEKASHNITQSWNPLMQFSHFRHNNEHNFSM